MPARWLEKSQSERRSKSDQIVDFLRSDCADDVQRQLHDENNQQHRRHGGQCLGDFGLLEIVPGRREIL
jgi:hypothetical protein